MDAPVVTDAAADREPVESFDWSDWGLVLSIARVGDKVDYWALSEDSAALDRLLGDLARVGPESTPNLFPERNDQLAYWINAHNAALLRSLLALADDGQMPVAAPGGIDRRYAFPVDGHKRTPADMGREIERLAGDDWRVRFAVFSGTTEGPPLPERPMLGDMLGAQLDRLVPRAFASPQIVLVDHGADKRLLVWSGLYEVRARLVADYERRMQTRGADLLSVLLERSDRPRREWLNTAVGYPFVEMPVTRQISIAELTPKKQEEDGQQGLLPNFVIPD